MSGLASLFYRAKLICIPNPEDRRVAGKDLFSHTPTSTMASLDKATVLSITSEITAQFDECFAKAKASPLTQATGAEQSLYTPRTVYRELLTALFSF